MQGPSSLLTSALYQSGDHVSCEDLLEFALDKPDSRRTSGPQHGEDSDECKLIRKILKKQVRDPFLFLLRKFFGLDFNNFIFNPLVTDFFS